MNAPVVHEGQQHQRQQLHHEPRFPLGDPKLDANDKVTIVGVLCTELRDYKTLDSDKSSWLISYAIGQCARVGNRRDGLETHHTNNKSHYLCFCSLVYAEMGTFIVTRLLYSCLTNQ